MTDDRVKVIHLDRCNGCPHIGATPLAEWMRPNERGIVPERPFGEDDGDTVLWCQRTGRALCVVDVSSCPGILIPVWCPLADLEEEERCA